ncbi:MAG TPA: hypothetical protein VFY61_14305 [Pyrinomonadaceae bacterium]|nr:hypothetical protein [Pyrinomonadaceae bacterium]
MITIEPCEGEDAKFILSSDQSRAIELVQYKKVEAPESTVETNRSGDDWKEGPITASALKKWITRKRPDTSVEDILNQQDNAFFTAVVFGEIAQGLKAFIPAGLQEYLSSYSGVSKEFNEIFPVDYAHQSDPMKNQTNKKLLFGDPALRQRVRLVRFTSPIMLELQCRFILERFYAISRGSSANLVDKLLIEIAKREGYKTETDRQLLRLNFDAILAEGKRAQNKWQNAGQFLQQHVLDHSDANRGEPPRWIDFQHGRFAKFDEFEQGWSDLLRSGFVIICGLPGTGKTVLAQYLAYRFITEGANRAAYYLQIKSNLSLQDEIEFLEDRLHTDTIFIVDDQHLAFDEVEVLAQLFADYHSIGKATARLVVTSVQTFGKTGRGKRGRESVLRQATLTRLIYGETDRTKDCISLIRQNCGLETPLTDSDLMSLSGGNLGLALLIARCAHDVGVKTEPQGIIDSQALKQMLSEWLLMKLDVTESNQLASAIVPIFICAASSLPISGNFTQLVPLAADAGFLDKDQFSEGFSEDTFFTSNYALAKIVRRQYQTEEIGILTDYMKKYPQWLPLFCERLGETTYGPEILRELFRNEHDYLVTTVSDPVGPLRLDEISKILRFINLADHGGEDVRFLRALMASDGAPNYRFFSRFIRRERILRIDSVTVFFDVIHRIDGHIAQQVAATIGEEQLEFLVHLIEESNSRLDQIGSCLRALTRCSRNFAQGFYERLKGEAGEAASPSLLQKKIQQTSNNPRELHIWVRFCEGIRSLSRRDCYDYLDQYLPKEKLFEALANTTEFTQIAPLLLSLHKLNSKLAAQLITEAFHQSPQLIKQLLRNDPKIVALSNDLFVLSELNRRLAVSVAFDLKEKIEGMMSSEVHYNDAASVLHQLSNSISMQLARQVANSVNRDAILSDFKRDLDRVSMVGRSLYNIAQVSQELGDWFGQRLNYVDFMKAVSSRMGISSRSTGRQERLAYSYTQLIRGFLVAADPELGHREQLLKRFKDDSILINNLKDMWLTKCNLTEVGFFLSNLLAIPVAIADIFELIGVDNLGRFRTQLLRKFERENSTLHFSNGLFAIAKIDLSLAVEALDIYLNRLRTESASQPAYRPGFRRDRRVQLPQNYQSDDLTDMGCLLRLAAAIDLPRARELSELLNLDSYVAYAIKETNWGRLAVFIKGLSEASRTHAIKFIQTIGTRENWQEQYFRNDILDNAIHYGLSLGSVSRAKAGEFIEFLLEQDKVRNDVYRQLELQANLDLISKWLRLLPMRGPDFVAEQCNRLQDFLVSTAKYDQRLQASLSAAEALLECGEHAHARQFALQALDEESQMRYVTQLSRWLDLFHRAQRIGKLLAMPNFTTHLFSRFKDWYFFPKIVAATEQQPLLLAYMFHLLDSQNDFPHLQSGVRERKDEIIKAIEGETRTFVKTLSLILAKASLNKINQTATDIQWRQPGELGLIALTFASVFPSEPNPFLPPHTRAAISPSLILDHLNEAEGNLAFALTLYLATASGIENDILQRPIEEASRRADDEVVGSIRWLLRTMSSAKIDPGHHYLWSLIKRALLSQTYLTWENDLEETVNHAAFLSRRNRDFEALLA